jgi:hypothetical protein
MCITGTEYANILCPEISKMVFSLRFFDAKFMQIPHLHLLAACSTHIIIDFITF